jgi:hypothetical protein
MTPKDKIPYSKCTGANNLSERTQTNRKENPQTAMTQTQEPQIRAHTKNGTTKKNANLSEIGNGMDCS